MASACSGLDTEKPPCLQAPAVDSKHGGILAPNPARPSYRIQVWCVVMGPSRPVRPQRQLQGTQWAAQRLHLLTSQLCSLNGLQSPLTFPVRNITPATSRPGGPHKLHQEEWAGFFCGRLYHDQKGLHGDQTIESRHVLSKHGSKSGGAVQYEYLSMTGSATRNDSLGFERPPVQDFASGYRWACCPIVLTAHASSLRTTRMHAKHTGSHVAISAEIPT